jgi:hypothetical protein
MTKQTIIHFPHIHDIFFFSLSFFLMVGHSCVGGLGWTWQITNVCTYTRLLMGHRVHSFCFSFF